MFTEKVSVTTTPPPPMRLVIVDDVDPGFIRDRGVDFAEAHPVDLAASAASRRLRAAA